MVFREEGLILAINCHSLIHNEALPLVLLTEPNTEHCIRTGSVSVLKQS